MLYANILSFVHNICDFFAVSFFIWPGVYWFGPDFIPPWTQTVLQECLAIALHESKPDVFTTDISDRLKKSCPVDGLFEGNDGFWRHIWNVAEVVLDQQRWRHFPDSMIRDLVNPRACMQAMLMSQFDGCYSLGFRVADWRDGWSAGKLRLMNDIICSNYPKSCIYYEKDMMNADVFYQRNLGLPFISRQSPYQTMITVPIQDLPDDVDFAYRAFVAEPEEKKILRYLDLAPPFWRSYIKKLEQIVNDCDVNQALDFIYGPDSQVGAIDKQNIMSYGGRLLEPNIHENEARYPCYYAGLPSMACHAAGKPWWTDVFKNGYSMMTGFRIASGYRSKVAISMWNRINHQFHSLRATRLSAEEDHRSTQFAGFPGGRFYNPKQHCPYDPMNKFRLFRYMDLTTRGRSEQSHDIGGVFLNTTPFEQHAKGYPPPDMRDAYCTFCCENDDLNMQF